MRIMRIKKKRLRKYSHNKKNIFFYQFIFTKSKFYQNSLQNSNNLFNCYLVIRKYKNIQENK